MATMTDVRVKTVDITVKAAGPDDDLGEGQFVGYASVFGNVDSYGDIVEKGAFANTIAEWQLSSDTLSCLWAHDMTDPFSNIGEVTSVSEDDHGLLVKVQLDLDNPKAMQIYRLAKGRRLTQMSFAYDVLDGEKQDDGFHLKELKLYEVSLVPIGANQLTDVVAIKSMAMGLVDGVKAGRILSAKNETAIRDAVSSLQKVLQSLGNQEDGEANTEEEPAKTAEEPEGAKAVKEPAHETVSVDPTELELELLQLI